MDSNGALGEIRTPDPRNRNPMLYPAELRAPHAGSYQTWPDRASSGRSLVAGMPPAVLADIGGGALAAEDGGGAIIIGEGAGLQSGAVIVQVADRVGQPPIVQVVPIMAGVGQVWGQGRGGQQGGGNQKLRFGHFDSPEVLPETIAISSWTDSRACVKEKSTQKQRDRGLASDSIETCAGLELGRSDFAFKEKRVEKLRKTP